MKPNTIAYLAGGKLRVKVGAEPPKTLDSQFANTQRDRASRAAQRHTWKSQAGGDNFLSGAVLWGKSGRDPGALRLAITSISRGAAAGQILYSLESDHLCALLALESLGAEERRLWNNNNHRIDRLSSCPGQGHIAFSVRHKHGTANIGVMLADDSGFSEVTEGDSVDTSPRWIPGPGRQLVFQSAGVGRNRHGHFAGLGPFSIQKLDLDGGEMVPIAEEARHDLLTPMMTADGTLYHIRRPYRTGADFHPLHALRDLFLLPFRVLFAIFQFLNFFTMAWTGRKLTTAGGAKARELDPKEMMIWGNLVKAAQGDPGNTEGDLVPASWQLVRVQPGGEEEVIAKGVLAFDLAADGTILYTNGSAIFALDPSGRAERIVKDSMIEQVAVLETGA